MKTISLSEFEEKVNNADVVKFIGHTNSTTRHGSYFSVRKGMTSRKWFIGTDSENNFLVELIG